MKLILASTSVYRRRLLEQMGVSFEAISPEVDEKADAPANELPAARAQRLALAKAQAVSLRYPKFVVIGSDQVANHGTQVLHKPKTMERAMEQLTMLQGNTHELHTAVAVMAPGRPAWQHLNVARLHMRKLSTEQIRRYLQRDQPFDCAGSYKIEKCGIALMESIDCDDTSAIQGLPLIALTTYLISINFPVL